MLKSHALLGSNINDDGSELSLLRTLLIPCNQCHC